MTKLSLLFAGITGALWLVVSSHATEFHVALTGNDTNPGTKRAPFRTIQRAADLAQPGDRITVHAGTYRERVNPPRGGTSDSRRITYQAARGEKVEIKGSEVIKGWTRVQDDVWKVTLPNSFFGEFNPYADRIHGDWFVANKREHHTGAVYLNGDWLTEAAQLEQVLKPAGTTPLWFGRVDEKQTIIWAQFQSLDPNEQRVEINVRRTVFYPSQPGRNYITVRGFALRHAATPWAPPTAEQVGLIGTHWSKGWIIENNVISHSKCSGITLGKYGDEWDNQSANSAEGYVKTIERALTNGWNRETIGHHLVRNNEISHCEQTGICGSLGAIFSTLSGNTIHDIYVQRLFSGAEMGGIKLHGAIDCRISANHVYRAYRGLWLDWMAQGTRVSANLFHDNSNEDLYTEVDHGPFVLDNNVFLSPRSVWDMSEGGAYVHNLMAGKIVSQPEKGRQTPYHPPHSTAVAGLRNIQGGDHRFYNNLFVGNGTPGSETQQAAPSHAPRGAGFGLWAYDVREVPIVAGGNVYLNGARPWACESNATVNAAFDPKIKLLQEDGRYWLELTLDGHFKDVAAPRVATALLGKARIPDLPFVNPDDTELRIDTDFFGKKRSKSHPTPGPFEAPGGKPLKLLLALMPAKGSHQ